MRVTFLVLFAVAIVLGVTYLYLGGAAGFGGASARRSAPLPPPPVALDPQTIPNSKLPVPKPELSPKEVVRTVMEALQHNDQPWPDGGIETAFNFASPSNKAMTGPLERFIPLVKNPLYVSLINPSSIEYGTPTEDNGRASLVVTVMGEAGEKIHYRFVLSRQNAAPFTDCWMTDGVQRVRSPEDAPVPMQPEDEPAEKVDRFPV